MKKHVLLLVTFFTMSITSYAQEGIPVYFDYLSDNYYLVFPSMAGIGEGAKVRTTVRKQWFNVEDAPNLQTINAHFRLGESASGVGVILYNDANGYHSQSGFKATYAHHLRMGGQDMRVLNQLSFGLSTVYLQSRLDETDFRRSDPLLNGADNSVGYFNIDLGMSYNYKNFYTHVGVLNMLPTERNLYNSNASIAPVVKTDNVRRLVVGAGYIFGKNEWQLEPSVLFQLTDFTQEKTVDFNVKAYRDVAFGRLWGGVSYRRSFEGAQFLVGDTFGRQRLQLITPILGANIKNFMVSYNYSYEMGNINYTSGGFHQLTIGYNFGQTNRRYDCYCPAAQ